MGPPPVKHKNVYDILSFFSHFLRYQIECTQTIWIDHSCNLESLKPCSSGDENHKLHKQANLHALQKDKTFFLE